VVFFLADLEEAFFLSSSGTDQGAAPGALGGVEWWWGSEMGWQGEAGVLWRFITRGGMVHGVFGLYRPWRGLRAWDWARMAVERGREGQRSCLAW
jgi:hypothetical protein